MSMTVENSYRYLNILHSLCIFLLSVKIRPNLLTWQYTPRLFGDNVTQIGT